MAKKSISPMRAEYIKQISRLQAFVRRNKKKGLVVDLQIPELPKRVTKKRLEEIKAVKGAKISNKVYHADTNTGELIPIKEYKKANKALQGPIKKHFPSFDSVVISNFISEVSRFPLSFAPIAMSWLKEMTRRFGERDVAIMLQKGREQGLLVDRSIAYSDDSRNQYFLDMTRNLPGIREGSVEEIMEYAEQHENWENPL